MSNDPKKESKSKPSSSTASKSERSNFHVPEQTQISPDLDQKLLKQANKEFYYRRLIHFGYTGIAVLAAAMALAIIWYSNRSTVKKEMNGSATDLTESVDTVKRLLEKGDVKKLMAYSIAQSNEIQARDLPQILAVASQQKLIAEKLIDLDKDGETVNFGVLSKINTLERLARINASNDLGLPEYSAELMSFSNAHAENSDVEIRCQATFGILVSQIHDYLLDNSNRNFEHVIRIVDSFPVELISRPLHAKNLSSLAHFVNRSPRKDHTQEFFWRFGNRLKESDDPHLRDVGSIFHNHIVVANVDFALLQKLVLIPTQESLLELQDLVDNICISPFVRAQTYRKTLSIIAGLSRVKKADLETTLVEKLRTSIETISDASTREKVAGLFVKYDKCKALQGNKFQLPSLPVYANDETATVILFFSTKHMGSMKSLARLQEMAHSEKSKVRFVLVCIDESVDNPGAKFIAEVAKRFPTANVVRHPESDGFLNQCPLLSIPYFLITDRNDKVIANNVDISGIRKIFTSFAIEQASTIKN